MDYWNSILYAQAKNVEFTWAEIKIRYFRKAAWFRRENVTDIRDVLIRVYFASHPEVLNCFENAEMHRIKNINRQRRFSCFFGPSFVLPRSDY